MDIKSQLSESIKSTVIVSSNQQSCIRKNPTLVVDPKVFSGAQGQSFSYDVTLTNNNSYCPDTLFKLGYKDLPASFSSKILAEVSLKDGESIKLKATMDTTLAGNFSPALVATDGKYTSYSAQEQLEFRIAANNNCSRLAPTLSLDKSSLSGYVGDKVEYKLTLKIIIDTVLMQFIIWDIQIFQMDQFQLFQKQLSYLVEK